MNDFGRPDFPAASKPYPTLSRLLRLRSWSAERPMLMALAVLPVALALGACQSRTEQAAELAQQADTLAQAGNLDEARRSIAKAISLREDETSYHQLLGVIAMRSGDPIGAYRAFQRALEFDASNRLALAYVANIGVQIGQISDAEDAADRLLTLDPAALPALQVKGMVALSRNKFDDAIGFADKILAINPDDEAGAIVKARALAKTGHGEEAIALIEQALTVNSASGALLANKVNLYRFLRQPEPMLAALDEMVGRDNISTKIKLDRINLLYRLGQEGKAREAAIALLKAGSRDPGDYRIVQRLWWQFDPAPIPEGPLRNAAGWKDPLALVQTVRYLLARNDLAAADTLLRTAPANARALLASLGARHRLAAGREAEARQQVAALLAKDSLDVDALLLKARFAAKDGDFRSALEAAQLAQTNDPMNPEGYIVLAGVYQAQDAEARARQVFEAGIKMLPQNFHLLESYAQYLHQSGARDRAMTVARTFARANPSSERAWSFYASRCQAANDQACLRAALAGLNDAKTAYLVDDPPGTAADRGLYGRI
jgi:tetratricopeptide (TPR) repeat protein